MKTASGILIIMILGGCASTAARRSDANKAIRLEALNKDQMDYMEWTNRYFASYLNREEFAGISDSSKRHLEQEWIAILQGPWSEYNYYAINSLVAIKSKKAVETILKIAAERRQKDNRDRWMATRALGILGDESVVPELINLIYHYNKNTRLWAQISLVRLTGVNFGDDWSKWAQWWNREKGDPLFSSEKVVWTAKANGANQGEKNESGKASFDRSKDAPARSVETYIVTFEPVGEFKPRTARELLNAFNENHPRGVRTHHYRTRAENDRLRGHICVDTKQGADKVASMLEESKGIKLVEAKLATQADLDKLFKLGQPSLKQ